MNAGESEVNLVNKCRLVCEHRPACDWLRGVVCGVCE